MDIVRGECHFCRESAWVVLEAEGEICHRCARKAVMAFVAEKYQEGLQEQEVEPRQPNFRDVARDASLSALTDS